jgi:hypothetical protein
MRYWPSRVANDVMRARSSLEQNGQAIWSNVHCPWHRSQIRRLSAAGVMNARSGSPPQHGQ